MNMTCKSCDTDLQPGDGAHSVFIATVPNAGQYQHHERDPKVLTKFYQSPFTEIITDSIRSQPQNFTWMIADCYFSTLLISHICLLQPFTPMVSELC